MPTETLLAWTRAFERLSIIGLSGLALFFGWDLFKRGILDAQSAEFRNKDFTINLQRVGPGIFFALFATATLICALYQPLIVGAPAANIAGSVHGTNGGPGASDGDHLRYDGQSSSTHDSGQLLKAINTFHSIGMKQANGGLQPEELDALRKADIALQSYKRSIMFDEFGDLSIVFYQIHDKVPTDPAILRAQSKEFQNRYEQMQIADDQTFLGDQQ